MTSGVSGRRLTSLDFRIWNREGGNLGHSNIETLNLLTMRRVEEINAIDSARRLDEHIRTILERLKKAT